MNKENTHKEKTFVRQDFLKNTISGIKKFIVAQVKLSAITFLIAAIGLDFIGISSPFLKAFFIALLDFIPVIGAGIVFVPWIVFDALWAGGNLWLYLTGLYLILLLARQAMEPFIVGQEIGLRPLYTFGLTLASVLAFGPIGVFIGPLAGIVIVAVKKSK
ncbi:MAG TPA: permease [Eubacteriaceae bacterium]|nr:permease [Eubacteriaceae bacterium]